MRITTGLLASLVLVAGTATAADTGFYAGAGVGWGKMNINENKLTNTIDSVLEDTNAYVERTDTSQDSSPWSLFVGYRLNPYIAAEIGYIDLGNADYKAFITDGVDDATIKGTWEASGWPLSVLGIWPITDTWEVFGRVGVFLGDVELTGRAMDDNFNFKESNSESSTQFLGGVGVNANFLDTWAARVEWQAMPSLGNDDVGSGNWNNLQFSILYKF